MSSTIPTQQQFVEFINQVADLEQQAKDCFRITPEIVADKIALKNAYVAFHLRSEELTKAVEAHTVYQWLTAQDAYRNAKAVVERVGLLSTPVSAEVNAQRLVEIVDECRNDAPIEVDDQRFYAEFCEELLSGSVIIFNPHQWAHWVAIALERYYYRPTFIVDSLFLVEKARNGIAKIQEALADGTAQAYVDLAMRATGEDVCDELASFCEGLISMSQKVEMAFRQIAPITNIPKDPKDIGLRNRQYVFDLRNAFLSAVEKEVPTAIGEMFNLPGFPDKSAPDYRTILRWLKSWRGPRGNESDEDAGAE
jgi:hypothetical protein